MARIFGGILGLIAFLSTLARGGLHGNDPETTLWIAWLSLLAFSGLGMIFGWIGGWMIEDAIHSRLLAQMEEQTSARNINQQAETA